MRIGSGRVSDWAIFVLSVCGIYISGVLTLSHLWKTSLPCAGGSGCDEIAQDPSAYFFGVPVAAIGFAAYLTLTILSATRLLKPSLHRRRIDNLSYLLSGIGVLVSIGFTTYAGRVLKTHCIWCLASAAVMTLLFVLHSVPPPKASGFEDGTVRTSPGKPIAFILSLCFLTLTGSAYNLRNAASVLRYDPAAVGSMSDGELVPAGAHRFGSPAARNTLVMFADPQCQACHHAFQKVLRLCRSNPSFSLILRHYPLPSHRGSFRMAVLAEIAGETGDFWLAYGTLYSSEAHGDLETLAQDLGISKERARRFTNANDPAYVRVARDFLAAKKLGLKQTPTFILVQGKHREVLPSSRMSHLFGE